MVYLYIIWYPVWSDFLFIFYISHLFDFKNQTIIAGYRESDMSLGQTLSSS